jgi:lipopolysaccharide/colanic/teichoic acid biosynthesis glycosyltransferase
MNFVGPRPERPECVQELAHQLAYYGHRHVIRPGLTGWAQVRYGYARTTDAAVRSTISTTSRTCQWYLTCPSWS